MQIKKTGSLLPVNSIISHFGGDLTMKKAQISLNENAVYRVIDGKLEKVDVPGEGFGKQIIHWQDGKPLRYEISYTKR